MGQRGAIIVLAVFCTLFADISLGSRNRREPDPLVIGAEFEANEKQQANKFKPKFERCDDYKPEVPEESPGGTSVIRVFASDDDGSDTSNGRVTYSIVSTHNKFTIDPSTGLLKTSAVFNRDEPDREKLVHVTVKASDNGRPQLEDVCTLAVKVTDKNDNSPVFDRANYVFRVAQDTPVETPIMRVSATDVDEGDNQRIVYDFAATLIPNDMDYFSFHYQTGVVYLKRKLDKPIGYSFVLRATASDSGRPERRSASTDLHLEVRESDNKAPTFLSGSPSVITLKEGYNRFSVPIATYTAASNIPGDDTVFFRLVPGRTEKTNKDGTFRAYTNEDDPKSVNIYLAKALAYEKVSSYTLTLVVSNSPDLVAETLLTVNVEDENNQAPIFTNVESGNVLEHEPAGTSVMTVSAVDNDGTDPNNRVTYRISDRNPASIRDKFEINADTGLIRTRTEFDREEQAVYAVTIDAVDGAPSSLLRNGKGNVTPQKFRIAIADKNDNPPYFPQNVYRAEVPEDQDVGSKVIEVRAKDLDTEASITTYQIISGDPGKAFKIEEQTGFIRVARPLDYESIRSYRLEVGAFDGQFNSRTKVDIEILNVNDMRPVFAREKYTVEETEETRPDYPILTVTAVDPDIGDDAVPQNITYYMDRKSEAAKYFSVDPATGAVRIIKKLDRDPPNGYPTWNTHIFAKDQNGGPGGIESYVEFEVKLTDLNDNAPFLDMPGGLVWYENQGAGLVGELVADDYDTEEYGPPFTYKLDPGSDPKYAEWFGVQRMPDGRHMLRANVPFDRELRKRYDVPIYVCDQGDQCATSLLDLVIGDVNDNKMSYGFSEIYVYNYEGAAPDTVIGRVYVTDPDDWDLPDKSFRFKQARKWSKHFGLDRNTGEITMKRNIPLPQKINHFSLEFVVEDSTHGQVGPQAVNALVNVTIQKIPKEAVLKSGSMRVALTPEEFVAANADGVSLRDTFRAEMSNWLNASTVDVFTVLPVKDGGMADVRFSAHGSPYYRPEKLEGVLARRKYDLQRAMRTEIAMIRIDECLSETAVCRGQSCSNQLDVRDRPVAIYTNTTSFVGVHAAVRPVCRCPSRAGAPNKNPYRSCHPNPCLNGGECEDLLSGYKCRCPSDEPDVYGPNCERLAASYNGQGWSWHRGLPSCGNSRLSFVFKTTSDAGLMLYNGPSPNNFASDVTDFLAVELRKGKPNMLVNFGDGTHFLDLDSRVDDGEEHYLLLRWTNDTVQMELDGKTCANEIKSGSRHSCFVQKTTHDSTRHYLNTNGPMHVGGISFDSFTQLASSIGLKRNEMPKGKGFAGCIKNLTFSADGGKGVLYDLGNAADGENYTPGCDEEFVQAVVAMDLNMNFLIAILVCLAVILVAVIVLAVYRRKRNVFGDKDADFDIRENIINYEDEGGGEGDQTGYDLSVLRMMSDGTPALHGGHPDKVPMAMNPHEAPDIQTFLQTNKQRIDLDPEAMPYDDLRHYAYEGDGNSVGSLSSLNSGTSDGDLEFDYLHNFGPRFKKLADMYGEEPDSSDDDDGDIDENGDVRGREMPQHMPPSESWC